MEMAHFKKYSSFSEKRYAFVKWQISVQPLHNIIILIGSKNWKDAYSRSQSEFLPSIAST